MQSNQSLAADEVLLQGLSDHYKHVVESYLKFTHHKTELHLREVSKVIEEVKDSRLLDNQYSLLEVKNIIDALETVLKSTIKSETQYSNHTSLELLRQVFKEADDAGFKLKVDISSIENEETLQEIAKMENNMFPKSVGGNKLPSLKTNSEDILKLKKENDSMREQLTTLQKSYNEMMKEKTEITNQYNTVNDELKKLKNKLQGTHDPNDEKELEELRNKVSHLNSIIKSQNEELEKTQVKASQNEQKVLQLEHERDAIKKDLVTAQNELTLKVNQTSQFQNMMTIVKNKNEELKELRDKLKQLDPSFQLQE
ncbi:hypothetical protein C9374_014419 [Naegleria lovaniensis]|uniref:Leucine zipper transcription factor-like protein 1 n=1 Tax=Naegleria lovaniensis TaxID=51637 RepID=A0AA88KPE7_NAELO|nr:uncharacterized protein C9374_014419 [Naegleria lovaniensis]KAG2389019.1 hypothetical protein C9374_014419 [Naegleria lovaniensis]